MFWSKKRKINTSTSKGRGAEAAVSKFLRKKGFKILDLNWRTRYCEIDVIAESENIIYFVEVKYRKSGYSGSGFDYITSTKLKQMHFAAEHWITVNEWNGSVMLAAAEVTGESFDSISFTEIL